MSVCPPLVGALGVPTEGGAGSEPPGAVTGRLDSVGAEPLEGSMRSTATGLRRREDTAGLVLLRCMPASHVVLLVLAGVGAGIFNGVAGGGSLISFPILLGLGYPALTANITNTVGIWPGYIASAAGYRSEIGDQSRRLVRLTPVALAGGIAGALLLLTTSPAAFDKVVPWLVLGAAALFAAQPALRRALDRGTAHPRTRPVLLVVGVFAASVYGGYFGAAMGVVFLAVLGLALPVSLAHTSGLRAVLSMIVNGIAAAVFIIHGGLAWEAVGLLALGSLAGGYVGARLALALPAPALARGGGGHRRGHRRQAAGLSRISSPTGVTADHRPLQGAPARPPCRIRLVVADRDVVGVGLGQEHGDRHEPAHHLDAPPRPGRTASCMRRRDHVDAGVRQRMANRLRDGHCLGGVPMDAQGVHPERQHAAVVGHHRTAGEAERLGGRFLGVAENRAGRAALDQAPVVAVGPAAEALLARRHPVAHGHRQRTATRRQDQRGAVTAAVAHRVAQRLVDRPTLGDLLVQRAVRLHRLDRRAGREADPGRARSCPQSESRSSPRSISNGRRQKPSPSG